MKKNSIQDLIASNCPDYKDFPKPGIIFKDVSELFLKKEVYRPILEEMVQQVLELQKSGQGTRVKERNRRHCRGRVQGFFVRVRLGRAARTPIYHDSKTWQTACRKNQDWVLFGIRKEWARSAQGVYWYSYNFVKVKNPGKTFWFTMTCLRPGALWGPVTTWFANWAAPPPAFFSWLS